MAGAEITQLKIDSDKDHSDRCQAVSKGTVMIVASLSPTGKVKTEKTANPAEIVVL